MCSRPFEEWEQDMALDHRIVGVDTRSSAILAGPMISVMRQCGVLEIILGLSG